MDRSTRLAPAVGPSSALRTAFPELVARLQEVRHAILDRPRDPDDPAPVGIDDIPMALAGALQLMRCLRSQNPAKTSDDGGALREWVQSGGGLCFCVAEDPGHHYGNVLSGLELLRSVLPVSDPANQPALLRLAFVLSLAVYDPRAGAIISAEFTHFDEAFRTGLLFWSRVLDDVAVDWPWRFEAAARFVLGESLTIGE